ncbi:glycosyltransferase [Alteromonas gilva]|uniref:Glycosyltransferase n=1 Tax=Alteromonas gilva TaxID=2987522 RepID=A0ABT5L6N4_9ALTE|nr:glycosyltransferase [Alteromonas gilva]MDC8832074.1 glycosyltransferase [Alteromonas gilva]
MRILHLELGRHLYGGAKQVEYLINAIHQQSNAEQLLVCAAGSDIAGLDLPGCNVIPLPYAGEADISLVWRLSALIRNHKPDIFHTHSRRGADVWGALVARNCNIPAVCTRRVDNVEGALSKFKYAQYKAVISISEGVKKVVSTRCPATVHQQVIHSAVDLAEFNYSADKAWFYHKFDIPSGVKVIANFAQLITRKGQSELISAMQEVVKHHPNTLCLLFGKGKMHSEYQRQVDRAGLQQHVRLCGFTNEVAKILPNIDLLVHPAHAEGLGVILLQAGACKVPVIASPSGGIPEIIIDRQTGWLTPAGNSQLLGDTIANALNSAELRQQYGQNLYDHVSTHFSTAAMAREYIELYNELKN